jgi:hypothetical protein
MRGRAPCAVLGGRTHNQNAAIAALWKAPSTLRACRSAKPYERARAHPKLSKAIKRLRAPYCGLDLVASLAEVRAAQDALGKRTGKRRLAAAGTHPAKAVLLRSISPSGFSRP